MEERNTDFSTYSLYELLDDPDFINWILMPDDALTSYWQVAQNNYPHLLSLIPTARKLILSLQFKEDLMINEEQQQLWERIAAQSMEKKTPGRIVPMWIRSMAAAILAGVIIATAFYFYTNRKTEITTPYGQIRTVILPDKSEVTLNANSQLRYAHDWYKNQTREVWVEGEAFFKVNRLHQYGKVTAEDRFIVHAGKVDIEVLGTTFNVNDRRGAVNVELVTGKISISIPAIHRPPLIMQPGDVLKYQDKQNTIVRQRSSSSGKIILKDGMLTVERITLGELFTKLEEMYGYKVIVKRPDIKLMKLSGRFSIRDQDNILRVISMVFGISIEKDASGRQLIVQ